MATSTKIDLSTMRFKGARFEGHALDVECTQELVAYRGLVLACAKELWLRRNPDRSNLPRRFGESFRVEFDRVEPGSATVPLQRLREAAQGQLDFDDEFDEAALLLDAAISAAARDELLPETFPANVVPLFRGFGRTLRPDETLFTRARRASSEAPYTALARLRLAEWYGPTYQDRVDVSGEVRMANLGPGAFKLQPTDGTALVDGRFEPGHEAVVLEALRNHRQTRLRVAGLAEFSTADRQMRRFIKVDSVQIVSAADDQFDDSAAPIWEELSTLGGTAPQGTWDGLPNDLASKIDEVVYGQQGNG